MEDIAIRYNGWPVKKEKKTIKQLDPYQNDP
jgi:hypothetical protein